MTQYELTAAVAAAKQQTKSALETIYAALNPGQRKQIVKDAGVKALFNLYEVAYDE